MAYNTVISGSPIPRSLSLFSGVQIPVLIQKYRFFVTNLKNNFYDLFSSHIRKTVVNEIAELKSEGK
jgi:hypothetical protein